MRIWSSTFPFFFLPPLKIIIFLNERKKKESEQNVSNEFLGRPQKMKNKIILCVGRRYRCARAHTGENCPGWNQHNNRKEFIFFTSHIFREKNLFRREASVKKKIQGRKMGFYFAVGFIIYNDDGLVHCYVDWLFLFF